MSILSVASAHASKGISDGTDFLAGQLKVGCKLNRVSGVDDTQSCVTTTSEEAGCAVMVATKHVHGGRQVYRLNKAAARHTNLQSRRIQWIPFHDKTAEGK